MQPNDQHSVRHDLRRPEPEPPLRPDQLTVQFAYEDFEPALRAAGIDPTTITRHEWSKFTDAFLDGTHWVEVAQDATDAIKAQRGER